MFNFLFAPLSKSENLLLYQKPEVHQPHYSDGAECDPGDLHAVLSHARRGPLYQLDGRGRGRGGQTPNLPLPCL